MERAERSRTKSTKGAVARPPPIGAGELRGQVLEILKELLTSGRTDEVVALVAKLVARNSELERKLVEATRGMKKNEGVSTSQLLLLLDELAADTNQKLEKADAELKQASGVEKWLETAETEKPPAQPPLRKPPAKELRRVDHPIAVPPEQRPCPKCGAMRECIGHDVTEVVDLIPAEVIVRLDRREKLACATCEGEVVRAPLGDKVVAGGKLGSALVAQVVVDKYRDGLPLHRQKERFERIGFSVAVSTLADQVTWATDLLRPLWRSAMSHVLAAKVMHLDGTSLPVRDSDTPSGIKLGSLWGYVGVEGDISTALYLYASTGKKRAQRQGELGPEDMLSLRDGYTVADASGLFDQSFLRESLIECGCNMHSRRYFTKALDAGDTRAALPLAAFKTLYDVEEDIRDRTVDERRAVRQQRSKPVYDELVSWCRTHRPHEPPSSALGKAIQYLLNHQVALMRFLGDGVIPVDNGVVERLHVRTAMTRKAYLFAGSDAGADRAAIAYTLLGCCALAEVNPVEYLTDVLPRLSQKIRLRDVPALLPAAWKASRPASDAAVIAAAG